MAALRASMMTAPARTPAVPVAGVDVDQASDEQRCAVSQSVLELPDASALSAFFGSAPASAVGVGAHQTASQTRFLVLGAPAGPPAGSVLH